MSVEKPSIIKIGSRTVDIPGENNWVGINVVEAGVNKAYLLSENYLGDLSNPMTADIVVNYMARVQTQYGVRMRAGYCVDLDSFANGEVIFEPDLTQKFALYVEKDKRSGFNFRLQMGGLKTSEELQEEKPEVYEQAYQEALSLFPEMSTNVDWFIQYFEVSDKQMIEALHEHPSFCYFLGKVQPLLDNEGAQVIDDRPDKVNRPVSYLTEGSAMINLKDKKDAMRWRGIFRHSIGTAVQYEHIADRLKNMNEEQKEAFKAAGFDFSEFDHMKVDESRNAVAVLHGARRQFDERNWHGLHDKLHQDGSPGELTKRLFEKYVAPKIFRDLIRIETHADHLLKEIEEEGGGVYLPDIFDAAATYADWTFGQKTVSLDERFPQIDATRADLDSPLLAKLKSAGKYFEEVFNRIFQADLLHELKQLQHPEWAIKILKAYGAPSGLSMEEVFPDYPVGA